MSFTTPINVAIAWIERNDDAAYQIFSASPLADELNFGEVIRLRNRLIEAVNDRSVQDSFHLLKKVMDELDSVRPPNGPDPQFVSGLMAAVNVVDEKAQDLEALIRPKKNEQADNPV